MGVSISVVLGGFGAVVARIGGNTVADYETVLIYGDPRLRRYRPGDDSESGRTSEIIVLEPDPLLCNYGRVAPVTQAWVDLFNLPGWQAARFVNHLLPQLLADAS